MYSNQLFTHLLTAVYVYRLYTHPVKKKKKKKKDGGSQTRSQVKGAGDRGGGGGRGAEG